MAKLIKNVNFNYEDVHKIYLLKNKSTNPIEELFSINYIEFDQLPNKFNVYKCEVVSTETNFYTCIGLYKNGSSDPLAMVDELEIEVGKITTLYFKYTVTESEVKLEIYDTALDIDNQYSGLTNHNNNYVLYDETHLTHDDHFNDDITRKAVNRPNHGELTANKISDIEFNELDSSIVDDLVYYTFKFNTLTTYFNGNNLVLGVLYEGDNDSFYLIKNSTPTGRNRRIYIPDRLIEEYKKTGIFQLIEIPDNIIVCTGVDLYIYDVANKNYYAEITSSYPNRSTSDDIHKLSFNLESDSNSCKRFSDTIINSPKTENYYVFYLPSDIDYCRKFLAIKFNSYNCYEFHTGNLLPGYNIDISDKQLHHIHSPSKELSTLTHEDNELRGNHKEGTEFGGEEYHLVNDTSPYTNYDSYKIENSQQILNDLGELELSQLKELYLLLKHGVNCTNGRGDLLDKFKYFRVLESGLCKFTKSTKGELILVVYSNLFTNLKKYIFKLAINLGGFISPIDVNDYFSEIISNIYIQLSNSKLKISYKRAMSDQVIYYLDADLLSNQNLLTDGYLLLAQSNMSDIRLVYKNTEFTVDNKLSICEV